MRRFKKLGKSLNKLKSPNLEKALVFLDDKLLGATSNAVERANRRFRKAQKSIYSVRTSPPTSASESLWTCSGVNAQQPENGRQKPCGTFVKGEGNEHR